MQECKWATSENGDLTSEVSRFRLIVRRHAHGARFLVMRHVDGNADCAEMLVASGTTDDTLAAKAAAMKTVLRLASIESTAPGRSHDALAMH